MGIMSRSMVKEPTSEIYGSSTDLISIEPRSRVMAPRSRVMAPRCKGSGAEV